MNPKLYSKTAIGISTLFLSPLFGAILFAYNLREVGKRKIASLIIIIGIIWIVLFRKLTENFLGNSILQLIIGNLVGSAILTFIMWDAFFLNYPSYQKKKILKPLLVFVGICAALLLFQIF